MGLGKLFLKKSRLNPGIAQILVTPPPIRAVKEHFLVAIQIIFVSFPMRRKTYNIEIGQGMWTYLRVFFSFPKLKACPMSEPTNPNIIIGFHVHIQKCVCDWPLLGKVLNFLSIQSTKHLNSPLLLLWTLFFQVEKKEQCIDFGQNQFI